MTIRPRLLLVGDEPMLLHTREMILGIGFAVNSSARASEALNFIQNQRYDLIVVCRATEAWGKFAEMALQQTPAPRILAITSDEEDAPKWAEAAVWSKKGPYELLKACSEMFGIYKASKSRGLSWRRTVPVG